MSKHHKNISDADSEGSSEVTDTQNIDNVVDRLESRINQDFNNFDKNGILLELKFKGENNDSKRNKSMGNCSNLLNNRTNKNIQDGSIVVDLSGSLISSNTIKNNNSIDNKNNFNLDISIEKDIKEVDIENNDKFGSSLISGSASGGSSAITNAKSLEINETNLSTLSSQLDNSKYFFGKFQKENRTTPQICTNDCSPFNILNKMNQINQINQNKINQKKEVMIQEDSTIKNKSIIENNKNNDNKKLEEGGLVKTSKKKKLKKVIVKSIKNTINYFSNYRQRVLCCDNDCCFSCHRKCRNCNAVTIIRNIFIFIIVVSAIGFYSVIFFFN